VLSQASLPRETSLAGLCGLVASAGLIVSTDTAMVHLADAFSVPCRAFFTTHQPEWRVRDYPLCRVVHLPAALPAALEFARGDDDRRAALAAWFPDGQNLGWLDRALGEVSIGSAQGPARSITERSFDVDVLDKSTITIERPLDQIGKMAKEA
jgi:hypothetical protein